jgi:hypothetical protein
LTRVPSHICPSPAQPETDQSCPTQGSRPRPNSEADTRLIRPPTSQQETLHGPIRKTNSVAQHNKAARISLRYTAMSKSKGHRAPPPFSRGFPGPRLSLFPRFRPACRPFCRGERLFKGGRRGLQEAFFRFRRFFRPRNRW